VFKLCLFDIPDSKITSLVSQHLLPLINSFNNKLMKGKDPRKHSLHEKTAASVFLSCSSVVVNDATPLTPPSACAELYFQMLTTYMYTPWSLRTRKIHNDIVRGDFLQPPTLLFSTCKLWFLRTFLLSQIFFPYPNRNKAQNGTLIRVEWPVCLVASLT